MSRGELIALRVSKVPVPSIRTKRHGKASFADGMRCPGIEPLRQLLEATARRLRNPHGKWVRNDFIGMQCLTCAAGYADVVVCEKGTASDRRAVVARVAPGAFVTASLAEAVSFVRSSS